MATLWKISFLTPYNFSGGLWDFLLPVARWAMSSRDGGLLTPGEQGLSRGAAPLSSCRRFQAYLWTWQLPPALGIFFSWSVGHSCGSAQGTENNISSAVPALRSAVHKVFCSVFPYLVRVCDTGFSSQVPDVQVQVWCLYARLFVTPFVSYWVLL